MIHQECGVSCPVYNQKGMEVRNRPLEEIETKHTETSSTTTEQKSTDQSQPKLSTGL